MKVSATQNIEAFTHALSSRLYYHFYTGQSKIPDSPVKYRTSDPRLGGTNVDKGGVKNLDFFVDVING